MREHDFSAILFLSRRVPRALVSWTTPRSLSCLSPPLVLHFRGCMRATARTRSQTHERGHSSQSFPANSGIAKASEASLGNQHLNRCRFSISCSRGLARDRFSLWITTAYGISFRAAATTFHISLSAFAIGRPFNIMIIPRTCNSVTLWHQHPLHRTVRRLPAVYQSVEDMWRGDPARFESSGVDRARAHLPEDQAGRLCVWASYAVGLCGIADGECRLHRAC